MKTSQKVAIGTMAIGAALCIGVLVVPTVISGSLDALINGTVSQWAVGCDLFIGVCFLGASLLFIRALPAFKVGMRRAYTFLIIGIICMTLTFTSALWLTVFGLTSPILSTVLAAPPYILAAFFFYESMRQFARLVNMKSLTDSYIFMVGVSILVAAIAYIVPYPKAPGQQDLHVVVAMTFFLAMPVFTAAVIAERIRRHIGAVYTNSMTWLFAGLFVAVINDLLVVGYRIFPLAFGNHYSDFLLNPLDMILSLLYLKAGQSFAATTEQTAAIAKPLDMVMFAAGLVSNPHDIDPILDKLRLITANIEPGQSFAPKQETEMFHIYLQLEEYLIHREPIRNFTREELRRKFEPVLLTQLQQVGG